MPVVPPTQRLQQPNMPPSIAKYPLGGRDGGHLQEGTTDIYVNIDGLINRWIYNHMQMKMRIQIHTRMHMDTQMCVYGDLFIVYA